MIQEHPQSKVPVAAVVAAATQAWKVTQNAQYDACDIELGQAWGTITDLGEAFEYQSFRYVSQWSHRPGPDLEVDHSHGCFPTLAEAVNHGLTYCGLTYEPAVF
ncbi:MAG: hypothetical protein ACREQ5_07615 [Candidatus Dormibacteria bacterium]